MSYSRRLTAVTSLILLLIVIMPWLPYLGKNTAHLDAWRFMSNAAQGEFLLHPGRPLTWLPWWGVYRLFPESFTGVQVFLILLQWGKVLAFWALLRDLPCIRRQPAALHVTAAALLAVYSTDVSLYWLGTLATQLSLLSFVLAVWLLLWHVREPHTIKLVAMVVCLYLTVGTHERYYALIFAAPLLLGPALLKVWRVALLWYAIPVLQLAYSVYAIFLRPADSYQSGLVDPTYEFTSLAYIVNRTTSSVMQVVGQTLWIPVTRNVENSEIALSAATGFIAGGLVGWWAAERFGLRVRAAAWTVGLGLVTIALGFLPFTITVYYQNSDRTFFLSVMGGAVVWAVAAWIVRERLPLGRWLLALFVAGFVAAHTLTNLKLHRGFREQSIQVQTLADALITETGPLREGTLLWVVFPTLEERVAADNLNFPWMIESIYQYVFQRDVMVCISDAGQQPRADCELRQDGIYVVANRERAEARLYPYERVVAIEVMPTRNTVTLLGQIPVEVAPIETDLINVGYTPQSNLLPADRLPARYNNVFDYAAR